jgi:PIN domain nuclease of toxin-antitoxin system
VSRTVLDASAFLAYLYEEPGADVVEQALGVGCTMSAVNWAEVLSKSADAGVAPERLVSELRNRQLLDNVLKITPLLAEDSLEMARLRPLTQPLGLSLADRACLALGKRLGIPVLTADQAWTAVSGIEIQVIRQAISTSR